MSKPGDFSFVEDKLLRETYEYDYKVISRLEKWGNLKNHNPNEHFMFSSWGNLQLHPAHSGASHAMSLRCMEQIAKNGWENFVKDKSAKKET